MQNLCRVVLHGFGWIFVSFLFMACQWHIETHGGDPPVVGHGHLRSSYIAPADPQMKAVLHELIALEPKHIATLSADDAREQPTPADAVKRLLKRQNRSTAPEPVADVDNRKIPGKDAQIPVRIYTPKGQGPFPVIVYYHGGGWVIATNDVYDSSARALTNAADAVLISVEYRKGPEHRFPAAHEDAYAAYLWALAHASEINGDPKRVAVAGEGAGGNLAAGVAMLARERGQQRPIHQLLVYPIAGHDFTTPSYQEYTNATPLNSLTMPWFFEKYLNTPADARSPLISLVQAKDLRGLPPATVITAAIDPLRSEGKRYAERLREAGVPVTYKNFEGVTHEFFGMGAVVDKAKQAVALAGSELKDSFGGTLSGIR